MQRVRISSHQSPVHKLGDIQITLSPKFRLAAASAAASAIPSASELELQQPLIPGLPDDIAICCLLRLPFDAHPECRRVCRRWRWLLGSKERFFNMRKLIGLREPWLFTLAFHRCTGRIQWQVLGLGGGGFSWHTIPAMPCRDRACPRGFGLIATPDSSSLVVCGGMLSDMECPLHLVLSYYLLHNRWKVLPPMLTPRSSFAGALINDLIYVAGGFSSNHFELSSAEVFAPSTSTWRPITPMQTNMAAYDSAVINGKLYITEGWVWPFLFSPRGQVYDPLSDSWESMASGMREGWTGMSAVVEGRLFVVSEHEKMRVKVYDAEADVWERVEGDRLPEGIRKPVSVSCSGGKIYVVGRGLHAAVGCVSGLGQGGKMKYSIDWKEVVPPVVFREFTPSGTQILFG